VCSLHQKEFEIKKLTVKYSDTSVSLQDLSVALDDSTLLAELNRNANIPDLNVSSVNATMRDKGGVMLQPWPIIGESGLKRPRGRVS
jgi:hypothetical protein